MNSFAKTCAAALFLLGSAGAFTSAQAQVNVNINVPSWGVAAPAGTQYYYVPEYGGYYDLRAQQYVVQRDGRWTRLAALNGYDPRSFHPVVVEYVGAQPWVYYERDKGKYGHPHGMPPGQAKKMGYGGPGRGNGPGNGHGKGHGKH